MNFILENLFMVILILLSILFIGGILLVSQIQWKSFESSLDKAMVFYSCL